MNLTGLQPWLQPFARQLLALSPRLQLTSVRRTYYQQLALYQAYLKGASRYPAARPGRSMHEFGRAFDVAGDPRDIAAAAAIWESWGGRWGAKFNDPIHFEA